MAECIILKGGNGADLDVVTAGKPDVLVGKVIVDKDGEPLTGTMPDRGAITQSLGINGIYTIPEGYHNGSGKVMQSIATMGAQTVNPTVSQQVVSTSGKYLTGNVTVNGVNNLAAVNIKKGVNVGGIVGTFEGYVPTATDLYLRGNNLANFRAYNTGEMRFDSGQISIVTNAEADVLFTVNFTGYNWINIEGYTSNTGDMKKIFITSIGSVDLKTGAGNYTVSINISARQQSGDFWFYTFNLAGAIYRIWLS